MPTTSKREIARLLCEDHPGIDNETIALELIDSFARVCRKCLIKNEEFPIENVGILVLANFKGSKGKRDARYNVRLKIPPRKVLKVRCSEGFRQAINTGRPPSTPVKL